MDPVTAPLIFKAGAAGLAGLSGYQSAKAQQQQAEINSYIGRTRANQTDTVARQGLESELGSFRAVMAANGQSSGVGTLELARELRKTRERERRIEFGNRMGEASQYKMQAQGFGNQAGISLASGLIKAGPSLFELYDYQTG